MDYNLLLQLKDRANKVKTDLPPEVAASFNDSFNIEYAHNSTAIEGNTLTLIQTKAVIEDGLSVGRKMLREIYEVVNHAKAFAYVQKCVADKKPLDENTVKDIHTLLMHDIIIGGVYRNVEVRIPDAGHKPPAPSEMYHQVKSFFTDLAYKYENNAVELAAWTHAEFVRIHPFTDGNGRTSRMIMNYQLMSHGFLPVSVAKENCLEPFSEMIAGLEKQRLEEYVSAAEEQVQEN